LYAYPLSRDAERYRTFSGPVKAPAAAQGPPVSGDEKIPVEFCPLCRYDAAMELRGVHRKYLRGLAHGLKPVVQVGRQGVTDGLLRSADAALNDHELIKVRFVNHKEDREELAGRIAAGTGSHLAGSIGNVAIFYRRHADPGRRKIVLPGAGKEPEEEET